MRVLLVQHSIENSDGCPLGLGYVAAVLREEGHTVSFLDLSLENGDRSETLISFAKRHRVQTLGFSAMTPQYNECLDLVKKVRPHLGKTLIVIGGAHPSVLPEEVLRDGAADIVVISEGEEIVTDLFQTLEEGGNLKSVPGIAFFD